MNNNHKFKSPELFCIYLRSAWYGALAGASMAMALWIVGMFFGGWTIWLGFSEFLPQNCSSLQPTEQNNSDLGKMFNGTENDTIEMSNNLEEKQENTNTVDGNDPLLRYYSSCRIGVIFIICTTIIVVGSIAYCVIFCYYCIVYAKIRYSQLYHGVLKRKIKADYTVKCQYNLLKIQQCDRTVSLSADTSKNNKELYYYVTKLVDETWIFSLRLGKDSASLNHKGIHVKSVMQVHNKLLWDRYKNIESVDLQNYINPEELEDNPILTSQLVLPQCVQYENTTESDVESGIVINSFSPALGSNEVFLFHGTTLESVLGIINEGFDMDRSKRGLYGKAIYMAECSEKADQYTDCRNQRRVKDLAMLVVRVNLGRIYCHDKEAPIAFSQEDGVSSVSWFPDQQQRETCDTVIAGINKRFREFLIFDTNRCYPEFVVFYDRIL